MTKIFFFSTVISSLLFAAEGGFRLGYVDLQKALHTVDAGKAAKSSLETEVTTKKAEIEKQQKALQKEAEEFEKKAAVMNEKTRTEKQAELQKKFMEFQRKAGEAQMLLQQKERDLSKPLIDEMRAIVEALGKEKGLQLVLEKNEGAVLYAESGSDLTDEVIARFNKKKGKK